MVKKIAYTVVATLVVLYLSSLLLNGFLGGEKNTKKKNGPGGSNPQAISENLEIPSYEITRGLVAKIGALTFYTYGQLEAMDQDVVLEDADQNQWEYKYINGCVKIGLLTIEKNKFRAKEPMTNKEAYQFFEALNNHGEALDLSGYKGLNKRGNIKSEDFMKIYVDYLLINKDKIKVSMEKMIVFGIESPASATGVSRLATDKGMFDITGLKLDTYMDTQLSFLKNGDKVLGVVGSPSRDYILTNSYIVSRDESTFKIFMGGMEREFKGRVDERVKSGMLCNLTFSDGRVIHMDLRAKTRKGIIKRVTEDYIELDSGSFPLTDDFKLYGTYGDVLSWQSLGKLIVGSDIGKFFIKDGAFCGGIIETIPQLSQIRVALNTTGYKGLVHPEVTISGSGEYVVLRNGEEKTYEKDQEFTLSAEELESVKSRIYIYPKDPVATRLTVKSIQRGYGNNFRQPSYRGRLEIGKEEGGYSIVNEVNFESYLYAVVPSEMPTSYGLETSKVQAVTARSYAYNQMYGNRYRRYGAHVDDSTSCQVYNNIPENEVSIKAVQETTNEGILFEGRVVSANFFSTSCGYTANSGEIWPNGVTKRFPNKTPSYLSAQPQFKEGEIGDLTKERDFYEFLKSDVDAYDKNFPWYRWHVKMSREEIERSINYNLRKAYLSSPYMVRTLDENQIFRSQFVEGVGELIDLQVYKRGEGGNIMELIIKGSQRTVKLSSELVIRRVLRPVQYNQDEEPIMLTLANDSVRKGHVNGKTDALPSSFFVMEKKKDNNGMLEAINFVGGGYGHGVGMSQNGAKGMADEGYRYQQILMHFYPGVKIDRIQ